MDLKIILDFDGVLFNTAFEAYSVCNRTAEGLDGFRQDVDFEEFLAFRAYVTDAWQYRRLYDSSVFDRQFDRLPEIEPDAGDWAFAERFFEHRNDMMKDPEWPKVMSPYDFFFLLKPLLAEHPEYFHVLSTRDTKSISRTMSFYGAGEIPICGQEDIRRAGSKIDVARSLGWLDDPRHLVVYVDDMNHHLEPFEGKVHLPLHADWGYDASGEKSLSQHQVMAIIQSMLKLQANGSAKVQ
ncbi:MAG TPA: hypothetical protein VF757_02155 [Sphingomicrobium sp.]